MNSANAPAPMLTLDSADDEPFHDAYIFGALDAALLDRTITIAEAGGRNATAWMNSTTTLRSIIEKLCKFERGDKDGRCILQGALAAMGGRRLSENMSVAHLLTFDVDNGLTVDDALNLLDGYFAVVWTTHSHNKTETFVSDSALKGFLKRDIPAPTLDDVKRYFVEAKNAKPELFEGAALSAHYPAKKGFVLTHRPWPKLRVMLALAKPFNFKERGTDEWKQRYHAAADSLRLIVDPACSDPSRLFYTPRIAAGALIGADHADIAVLPGKTFDLDAVVIPPKPEKVAKVADAPPAGTFDRAKWFQLMGFISAEERQTWLTVGQALHFESSGSDEGLELWLAWAPNAPGKFDEADQARVWQSFGSPGNPVTGGSIVYLAKAGGWAKPKEEPLKHFDEVATPGAKQPKQQQPSDLLEFPADIALADLLKQEANALVRGILHLGEQGCVYGLPGAGKSFIGVDLGFHIGLGKDWHGRKVTRAPVLYVALEGVRGFRKRMYAAKERLGDPGNFFSRLKVHISLMRQAAGDAGASTIMAAAKALAEKCGQPVGLIVIDTLARAVSGDDENAVEDMMAYLEGRAGAIARETGAHVLTVHHPNAEGKLRGSTSLPAAFDAILRIDLDSSGRRTLVGQKIKDDEDGPLFDFELEKVHLGTDEYGLPASSCVVRTVTRAVIEPEPKKGEKVWRESFEALREAGKLTQCTASDGATVGVRTNLNELRTAFCERYGTTEPDKAWRRTLAACPDGFVRLGIAGAEYIWYPL